MMKTPVLLTTLLLVACLLADAGPLAALPITLTGIHPQFGPLGGLGSMGTGKLLQEFHLPGSPADLFQLLLEYFLKQKLGNTLPLNLDATRTYPAVENAQLTGGPFEGKPLTPTARNLHAALTPGDYVVPVIAYCTQYSVHRPGQGTAYKLAPVEGTEAAAISTLLWRGTLAGKSPQELQAANWAIQSGIPYDSMPKPYQVLIDQLIPDYRSGLRGNMLDVMQSTYKEITTDPRKALQTYIKEKYNKTVPVMLLPKIAVPAPPLEAVLGKMGASGLLLLDAKKQSNILLTDYTTRERGEQVLFEGQGEQLPPEPAGEGPWTVRIPGQAYMRFIIKGGNMRDDNMMQIRVLPAAASAQAQPAPRVVEAAYAADSAPTLPPTSISGLLGVITPETADTVNGVQPLTSSGVIGYAVGGSGSQAMIAVAEPAPPARKASATITVLVHNRVQFPDKDNLQLSGLCMYLGAKIADPDQTYQTFRWVQTVTVVPEERCGRTFIDSCNEKDPDPQHLRSDPWYRPTGTDEVWRKAAQDLGYDRVFRDIPSRPLNIAATWQAVTELVGIREDGTHGEDDTLATVRWGWHKGAGSLVPDTVLINGVPWTGTPAFTDKKAHYLCDPYEITKNRDTDPEHNLPLPSPPPDYRQKTAYKFY